jgi:hypothetical protein
MPEYVTKLTNFAKNKIYQKMTKAEYLIISGELLQCIGKIKIEDTSTIMRKALMKYGGI